MGDARKIKDGRTMRSGSYFWVGLAMASAALFGASTPFAKLLLGGGLDPWMLAGLLYAGSGIGPGLFYLARRLRGGPIGEAQLQRADLPWLGLVILSGGVAGPVLLMLGLTQTSASSAALLLNVEGLATMGIAWVVFRVEILHLVPISTCLTVATRYQHERRAVSGISKREGAIPDTTRKRTLIHLVGRADIAALHSCG